MRKRKWRLFIVPLSILLLLAGCIPYVQEITPEEGNVIDNDERTPAATEEGTAAQSKDIKAAAQKERTIVDGYDITDATTGIQLKVAWADYFSFGAAINGTHPTNSTIYSDAMSEIFKYHFNSTTFSNLMKSSYLLDQAESIKNHKDGIVTPVLNFSSVVEGLTFARDNGMKMRGHTLVWHNQVPDWFFREGYTDTGGYVDKAVMLIRMESYIRQVLEYCQSAFPGVVYCWDVVNEAIENTKGYYETESGFEIRTHYHSGENLWFKVVGEEYAQKAFEYARKYAAPDVKLFYNDYNTFQPDKTQSIYDFVSYLKDKNLIDGIGMQSYIDLEYPGIDSGTDNVRAAITKFAELGLEIQMTELTIRSNDKSKKSFQRQAERYKELFSLYAELDTAGGGPANITNVTFFGLMDEYLMYENNTEYHRLFDGKLQPKPAFYSILSVVE